jgi:hypothetical protein
MSWWKYAGGLSPGPAAIPNPANPSGLAARLLRTRRRACGCPRGWITAPQAPPATRGTNARPWSPPKMSATGGPALLLLRLVPRSGPHRPAVFNLPQTPPTSSSSTWQKQRPAIPPSAHPGSAGIRTAPRETVARRQSRLFRALPPWRQRPRGVRPLPSSRGRLRRTGRYGMSAIYGAWAITPRT